jgi:hypothetical protein
MPEPDAKEKLLSMKNLNDLEIEDVNGRLGQGVMREPV